MLSGEMAGDLGGFSHGCLLSSIFNMISTWFHHRKVPIWRTWIHCFSSLQRMRGHDKQEQVRARGKIRKESKTKRKQIEE